MLGGGSGRGAGPGTSGAGAGTGSGPGSGGAGSGGCPGAGGPGGAGPGSGAGGAGVSSLMLGAYPVGGRPTQRGGARCAFLTAIVTGSDAYVGAAGRFASVSVYDRVVAATMRERAWRPALVQGVLERVPAGGRVVEVGAGTGSLALALAGARPDVTVTGVDGDPAALDIARSKGSDGRVEWLEGDARELPMGDGTVHALVMSLLLHHLAPRVQDDALGEARRVLRFDGRLHVADFGRPQDPVMAAAFAALSLSDGRENTARHAAGELPAAVTEAGFDPPRRWKTVRTGFGTLELISAAPGRAGMMNP